MDHLDRLNFLTGSETRWSILLALADEEKSFADLRTELDVPQSTLNRNLGKLTTEGWVSENSDRTYTLTQTGAFFLDRFQPLEDALTVVERLADYPDAFPLEEFDFDVSRLADGDWHLASENKPYTAINAARRTFKTGTKIRGFLPYYNPAYTDVAESIAATPEASLLGMVPKHQLDLATDDVDFDIGELDGPGHVEYRVWDADPDYALGIIDDEKVVLTGHHEGGMPSVMVETDDEEVREWAREAFKTRLDQSESIVEALKASGPKQDG